jgi:hypothetical protein
MKKGIANAIYVKNIAVWVVISCCCIVAAGAFVKSFFDDFSAGNEIFLPGVLILAAAIVGLSAFSVTRVIKYINRIRQNR